MRFHLRPGPLTMLLVGLLAAGCGGETDDTVVELDPAPQFDPVTSGGDQAGGDTLDPPKTVPKVTPRKKVPSKGIDEGFDEGFDEDLPMIPVEQAGAMVALEAIGAEVKLDFRDRIVDVDLKGTEFDDKVVVEKNQLAHWATPLDPYSP